MIAAAITFAAAVLTTVGILIGHAYTRLGRVEDRLDTAVRENRYLWLWARKLVDYGYTWRRADAPELPEFEDTSGK